MTRAWPLGLALLAACDDTNFVPLHFDGPVAAAVLPEGDDSPFDTPAGFVANARSGLVVPLDLKEERLLADDPYASFLRAAYLPTGRARTLSDVAVVGRDAAVVLWAVDGTFDQLLRVPYLDAPDADGNLVDRAPTASTPTFVDADGSGDTAELQGLVVRAGFTTTEDWSIEYDGTVWWARGSRSGTMTKHPLPDALYQTDGGELEFTLSGSATAGDRFDVRTDSGVQEWTLQGEIPSVVVAGDRLYAPVLSAPPRVAVMDAWTGDWLGQVTLPDDAQPWRLALSDDGRLWVTDARNPVLYDVRLDQDADPATTTVTSLALPAPAVDVAWQEGEDGEGVWFEHVFVAPFGLHRVDVWDVPTGEWVDPNPYTPAVEGIDLGSPVGALAASVDTVWALQPTTWGAYPRVPTVVVVGQDGYVFQLDAATGCYLENYLGAHGPNVYGSSDDSYGPAVLTDVGPGSSTQLLADADSGEQVAPSSCGGVTRSESWTLTYDSAALAWRVEGSLSGVQAALAFEDERYVSDDGAISFVIASGPTPSTDGDHFDFAVDRGLEAMLGTDDNDDGTIDRSSTDHVWELPARPATFSYTTGDTGGGWDPVDRREFALLPVLNSDLAAKLQLDKGKSTNDWN